ncbi:MAG: transporter associated domain-containing protein [Bacteroidia bacterium]|nr:transporter associated domain-containing protein [Bacteroidia bacterium]
MDPDAELPLSWLACCPPAWLGDVLRYAAMLLLGALACIASGVEIAVFSLPAASFQHAQDPALHRIGRMLDPAGRLLTVLRLFHTLVSLVLILLLLPLLAAQPGPRQALLLMLFALLLWAASDLVPRLLAAAAPLRIARRWAGWLARLYRLLGPLASLLEAGAAWIEKRLSSEAPEDPLDDIRQAIDLAPGEVSDTGEKKLLKGIVNFSNTPVRSIMQARVNIKAIDQRMPFDQLLAFIRENNYSRMPVYDGNLDRITGILHIKDLLPYLKSDTAPADLSSLLRESYFIPETKKIDALLEEFKRARRHMAVVVNEYGVTTGLVTLEDVIEEIFGEIHDEFDEEDGWRRSEDGSYLLEAQMSLPDVARALDLPDDYFAEAQEESDSLGGLVLERMGKIPASGERMTYKELELIVEQVARNRITTVRVVPAKPADA